MIPGEYILKDGEIILNENSEGLALLVANAGDRPVQVGSHYHFSETNKHTLYINKLSDIYLFTLWLNL